ncbi:GNAT family N-acetyltransferase [Candidatus Poribacteria bacterium]|nr:GNAT family N-acetyltransferase [Candidatus Poribacteria bacterium]
MQTIVLKNEDLDPTVMGEILEFRGQIFEEVYQLASDRPDSYSPEKPDDYDKQSVHFILRDEDGTIRAYARMIFGRTIELPIFNSCSTLPNPQTPAVEVSRFCVCPSYRGDFTGRGPLYVLTIAMIKYSLTNGINAWYVGFFDKFYYTARKLFNLSLQRFGDKERFSENTHVYSCLVDIAETMAQNKDKSHYQYVLAEYNRLMAQKSAA